MMKDENIPELSMDDIYNELTVDEYVNKPTLIPVFLKSRIVATVPFVNNLHVNGPSYLNDSGDMGLVRVNRGKLRGKLILLYEDEAYPKANHGRIISENEAYELCVIKGKYNLVKKFNIQPDWETVEKYGYDPME